MQNVDWDSWLLFLSKKGFFYVEIVSAEHRFHLLKVSLEQLPSPTRDHLLFYLAETYPTVQSTATHTKNISPLLVLHEDMLLNQLAVGA